MAENEDLTNTIEELIQKTKNYGTIKVKTNTTEITKGKEYIGYISLNDLNFPYHIIYKTPLQEIKIPKNIKEINIKETSIFNLFEIKDPNGNPISEEKIGFKQSISLGMITSSAIFFCYFFSKT